MDDLSHFNSSINLLAAARHKSLVQVSSFETLLSNMPVVADNFAASSRLKHLQSCTNCFCAGTHDAIPAIFTFGILRKAMVFLFYSAFYYPIKINNLIRTLYIITR